MPPVGFEPTVLAGDRPQTYALDRAATGTGTFTNSGFRNQGREGSLGRTVATYLFKEPGTCRGASL